MKRLSTILQTVNRLLILVAGIALAAMVVLTCANIFMRAVSAPIRGTFELMGFFGALVASLSLGYTQLHRGHIAVDVLIQRFPSRVQKILTSANSAVCALFFGVVAWQVAEKASVLRVTGEVTETLRIAYYPFTYGTALGCAFLALVFIQQLTESVGPGQKKEGE
jgi:TRAP-type C4-dicarboxylate transport system permease small subunit